MVKEKAFTIRLPEDLADQIDHRAKLQRRSRNSEIAYLLQQAIDASVGADLNLFKRDSRSGQT